MRADPLHRRARQLALFQAGTVAALLLAAALVASSAHAASSTIGRTWPIVEPDALSEIEGRASRLPPNMAARFGARERWSAMRAAPLAVTRTERTRTIVPFYTLDMDISLPGGKMLYPKGFTFNPLSYVTLAQRLVIVAPADLGWALKTAGAADWILLSAGLARAGVDALALGEKVGRPLFILEERVKQRLCLTVAPVIVRQVGQALELHEIPVVPARSAGR